MALVECRECKKQISTEAAICPSCGIRKPYANKRRTAPGTLLLAVVSFTGFLIWIANLDPGMGGNTSAGISKNDAIATGKESLEANLKDADSVEFGDVWAGRISKETGESMLVACGYYNARNGFGGMTGEKRFIGGPGGVVLTDDQPTTNAFNLLWPKACISDRAW
jgi:hypothetical protein